MVVKDNMIKAFGGFLAAFWFIFFIAFGWDNKRSASINIGIGALTFVIVGALYLVPVWMIFWR